MPEIQTDGEETTIYTSNPDSEKKIFAADIIKGLTKQPKRLSSKYFYDSEGSRLFQQIMDLPEYYLTRTETEIFQKQKKEIIYSFTKAKSSFSLVDLGAGDGAKTKILLRELLDQEIKFTYTPIDISEDALQEVSQNLKAELPGLTMQTVTSEYFGGLDWLHKNQPERKVVLFLGSNIGNFEPKAIRAFAHKLRQYLQSGDQILMGFDLQKDPHLIRLAYDDAAGITAAFNYNLLHRINQEFEADFDLTQFQHFAEYNPVTGDMKSYLVSKVAQKVCLKALNYEFTLEAWEAIHTETSHKFNLTEIKTLADETGFEIEDVFTDEKHYFADVLLKVV